VCIEDEDGKRVNISPFDPISRQAMAKTLLITSGDSEVKMKFVHRHLRNGDAMLLNRQPTLHKPSIMSHRYIIL
jgi:DNA-directed RNA polymerase I subunit RPA1